MSLILAACGGGGEGGGGEPPEKSAPPTVTSASSDTAPPNGAPIVTSLGFELDQDAELSARLTATDPENDPVTFDKTSDPARGENFR